MTTLLPAVQSGLNTINGALVTTRTNAAGRDLGLRVHLTGETKPAKELRREGKEAGLKGRELTEYVNSHLTGDKAKAAWIRLDNAIAVARQVPNAVPVHFDVNGKGNKFKAEIIVPKLKEAKESKATAGKLTKLQQDNEKLMAEIAELRKLLPAPAAPAAPAQA